MARVVVSTDQVTNLLEVFAEAALQELGMLMEQDQLKIIHHGGRVAPALASLSAGVIRIADPESSELTSIVCINKAMSSLIFSSSSAFVTPSSDLEMIRMAPWHIESQSSSTYLKRQASFSARMSPTAYIETGAD
jgi:hypothetical protein